MIREHVELRRPEFTVVLDAADDVADADDFEEMVDIVASIAVHALRNGVDVRVRTTAREFPGAARPLVRDTQVLDLLTPVHQAATTRWCRSPRSSTAGSTTPRSCSSRGRTGRRARSPHSERLSVVRAGKEATLAPASGWRCATPRSSHCGGGHGETDATGARSGGVRRARCRPQCCASCWSARCAWCWASSPGAAFDDDLAAAGRRHRSSPPRRCCAYRRRALERAVCSRRGSSPAPCSPGCSPAPGATDSDRSVHRGQAPAHRRVAEPARSADHRRGCVHARRSSRPSRSSSPDGRSAISRHWWRSSPASPARWRSRRRSTRRWRHRRIGTAGARVDDAATRRRRPRAGAHARRRPPAARRARRDRRLGDARVGRGRVGGPRRPRDDEGRRGDGDAARPGRGDGRACATPTQRSISSASPTDRR